MGNSRPTTTFEQRLLSRYQVDPATGCWAWTASVMNSGYGQIARNGRNVCAHRAMWEHHHDTIPNGLTIDHLCLNRRCVNPDHMELVTYSENNYRRFRQRDPLRTPTAA